MGRVVGYKRLKVKERQAQIYNCVARLSATKGFSTITDLAKALEMTPSTHLKKLALDMAISDKIDLRIIESSRGFRVYQFYLSVARIAKVAAECKSPWACDMEKDNIFHVSCQTVIDGLYVDCPVGHMNVANRQRVAQRVQFDENMLWAGDENGYTFIDE